MADALMKYETMNSVQIDAIMDGREPGPPKGWGEALLVEGMMGRASRLLHRTNPMRIYPGGETTRVQGLNGLN